MQWLIDLIKEWALGYLPKTRAYLISLQSIPTTTWTKILFDTEIYDTHGLFANYKFTAARAGYYLITLSAALLTPFPNNVFNVAIFKNGSPESVGISHISSTTVIETPKTDIVYLTPGDYIEGYCYHNVIIARLLSNTKQYTFIAISQLF